MENRFFKTSGFFKNLFYEAFRKYYILNSFSPKYSLVNRSNDNGNTKMQTKIYNKNLWL